MTTPDLFGQILERQGPAQPAFNYNQDTFTFTPTDTTNRIVDFLEEKSGKDIDIQPANSVMAIGGEPIWGSGHGEAFPATKLTAGFAVVDPWAPPHVVAHEGGHLGFFSDIRNQDRNTMFKEYQSPLYDSSIPVLNKFDRYNELDRENGNRYQSFLNDYWKPTIAEESQAQGIAYETLGKLGIFRELNDSGMFDPKAYPKQKFYDSIEAYKDFRGQGPTSPAEGKAMGDRYLGTQSLIDRYFDKGRLLVR